MPDTEPVGQNLISWAIQSLGPFYTIMLPLSAIVSFIFVAILLFRGKGPMAAASIILFVHAPLILGTFAAVHGMISSYSVIAMSATAPKPSDLAMGYSTALLAPFFSILLMSPSYMLAAFGTLAKSMSVKQDH